MKEDVSGNGYALIHGQALKSSGFSISGRVVNSKLSSRVIASRVVKKFLTLINLAKKSMARDVGKTPLGRPSRGKKLRFYGHFLYPP